MLLTNSCSEEAPLQIQDLVEKDLVIYFERFAEEAMIRGYKVDWSEENVKGALVRIEGDAVGQCLTYQGGRREINIDEAYWQKSSTLDREFLIFHELGHCILGRSHHDASKANGTCVSMMNSGESLCRKNYTNNTRGAYLDELFS